MVLYIRLVGIWMLCYHMIGVELYNNREQKGGVAVVETKGALGQGKALTFVWIKHKMAGG